MAVMGSMNCGQQEPWSIMKIQKNIFIFQRILQEEIEPLTLQTLITKEVHTPTRKGQL